MLRSVLCRTARAVLQNNVQKQALGVTCVRAMSDNLRGAGNRPGQDAALIHKIMDPQTDGWSIREIVNDIAKKDDIPEPPIVSALMYSARRLNDYALAVRSLEVARMKCAGNEEHWQYIQTSVKPVLTELGILTLEEIGYDKPELALKDVFDIH